ncbi:MAG: ABC transporter ATP-binding protein [Planctomycetota bacterium]
MDAPHSTGPRSPLALEARGLGRVFRVGLRRRRVVALDGVDLRVARGAHVGLVGPNGSGKSTLLRLAAGVDRPTSGDVRVFGDGPLRRPARERLAYLPDALALPPELRAGEALGITARLRSDGLHRPGEEAAGAPVRGRRALRRAVDGMLERVGLEDARTTPLGGFSRGMGRRFGLAQAFFGAPDLVLLDEPTAGLDAPGFPVLADLLAEARARGATIVVASHVATGVVERCDEVVLLARGRLVRTGAPEELLADPARASLELVAGSEGAAATAEGARATLERDGFTVERAGPSLRSLAELYAGADRPRTDGGA